MIRTVYRKDISDSEIFDRINEKYGFDGGGILSMGMSNSYAVAIEEGSTLIRVGRKLFEKTKGDR